VSWCDLQFIRLSLLQQAQGKYAKDIWTRFKKNGPGGWIHYIEIRDRLDPKVGKNADLPA
jgi:hypothetical protein